MAEKHKAEYAAKLKDPRWQKKRLEILNRDEWACRLCGDTENTLHVHHRYYLPKHEPWEYEDDALETLCMDCHQIETLERPKEENNLLLILRQLGWHAGDICNLWSGLVDSRGAHLPEVFSTALHWNLSNDEARACLFAAYFENLRLRNKSSSQADPTATAATEHKN